MKGHTDILDPLERNTTLLKNKREQVFGKSRYCFFEMGVLVDGSIFVVNIETMEALGKLLGRLAKNGDVFCLCGELGAGKTLLCREIASGTGG